MKIKFDKNVDYCIYIGGLQSGKSFIFKSIKSDSIHFSKELFPNIINVLSISSIFERRNILGINQYITAIKPKLNNCYILKNNFVTSSLKHINDVIRRYGNINIMNSSNQKQALNVILTSHYYTLKLLRDYNITYKDKDILSLPPTDINIYDFFEDEIKTYNIDVINPIHKKIDYEWDYYRYKEEIEKSVFECYGVKKTFDLDRVLNMIDDEEYKIKKKYGF